MSGMLGEFIDLDLLKSMVRQYEIRFERLKKKKESEISERALSWDFADIFDDRNNETVEGELQKLRFEFMKSFLQNIKSEGLVSGFCGFDLVMQYDSHNEMFILVDKWSDLDDELIAILYDKCRSYLERNPSDRCTVVELFGEQGIIEGWTGGDPEIDKSMSWISRDRLFCRIAGTDLTVQLMDFLSDKAVKS
jgi:hypothetical protein